MLMQSIRLVSGHLARHVTNSPKFGVGPLSSKSSYIVRHLTSPLNKRVKNTDIVKEDEEDYEIEIHDPVKNEIVPQKLIKRIPVEYHGVSEVQFNDETNWIPVYRVPWLAALRYVIRGKVYLTTATICCSTYYTSQILVGNWSGQIWQAGSLSLISLAGMTFIGDYFRRLVVQIYASEDLEYVRLCRFSFFGRRKDMILPKDCVVRLPEINRSLRHPMLNIKFMVPEGDKIDHDYDNYEFYELGLKLPIGLGGVLDRDRFQAVMGYMLSYRVGA